MTFAQLKADLYRRLQLPSSPASDIVTRLAAFLNETQEQVLAEPGLSSLLYGTETFASVASRARYGLSNIAQVRAITETTDDFRLQARTLDWYRRVNPDPASNEGTPEFYIPLGIVALQQVPAITGTGLWAVSSSGSDTVPTVLVDAVRVGGYPHTPSATTLTGTSRVQLGSLTDYIDATQLTLSVACVGDISIYDAASDGNLLAVIPRGQTAARYFGLLLYPTPSAAITYVCDVEKEVVALSADTDEPLLPLRFHRLLGIGARMKEYEARADARYGTASEEYERVLKDLKYAVNCPPDLVIVPGSGRDQIGSNLGPMYPAGRW